ncbi:MAG: hypothetical protein L3K09_03195 [Thermoplasmata archaeon]|nr:hypothetical protein [Thermoplasmata archaeon]
MPRPAQGDPNRATLLAILKQLNHAASVHEGDPEEQALELKEIEGLLTDFWAVKQGSVKVALALGLLLRNGLVEAQKPSSYSFQRQRASTHRYLITAPGKRFLAESIEDSDRIG